MNLTFKVSFTFDYLCHLLFFILLSSERENRLVGFILVSFKPSSLSHSCALPKYCNIQIAETAGNKTASTDFLKIS